MSLRSAPLALVMLAFTACSDSSGGGKDLTVAKDTKVSDSTVQKDVGNNKIDGKVNPDVGNLDGRQLTDSNIIKVDGNVKYDGASGLNCSQISACTNQCVQNCAGNYLCMLGCGTGCSAKGCTAAQSPWNNLYSCISTNCASQCLSPGATCDSCVTTNCASALTTCSTQTC